MGHTLPGRVTGHVRPVAGRSRHNQFLEDAKGEKHPRAFSGSCYVKRINMNQLR